jgi:NTP pyrophosphatase (non-canonical NTP hydrolase)
MKFKEIIKLIPNFGPDRNALYWGCCLAGEVGELLNLIKKQETLINYRPDKDISTKQIADELADIFVYTALFAQYFKIDLEDAILEKLDIVLKRLAKAKEG